VEKWRQTVTNHAAPAFEVGKKKPKPLAYFFSPTQENRGGLLSSVKKKASAQGKKGGKMNTHC